MSRAWRHTNDIEILQKLGIIDKGKSHRNSEEENDEDFGPMMTASEGETVEESDEEGDVIFDRARLLSSQPDSGLLDGRRSFSHSQLDFRNRKMASESKKAVIFRGILVCAAFFTVGLCLSIVGPTLPDIQSRTNSSSLSSVVSVISANSFGSIIGVVFGSSCYRCMNAFCVMAGMLLLCAASTLIIPWCGTITGVTFVCLFQGVTLGFLERGGYSMFYGYWRKKYHVIHLFYFSLAFGACISPLVTTPFVFSRLPFLNNSQIAPASTPYRQLGTYSPMEAVHSRRKFDSRDPTVLRSRRQESPPQTHTNNSLFESAADHKENPVPGKNANLTGGTLSTGATTATTSLPKKPKVAEESVDSSQKKTDEMLVKKAEAVKEADEKKKEKEEEETKKKKANESEGLITSPPLLTTITENMPGNGTSPQDSHATTTTLVKTTTNLAPSSAPTTTTTTAQTETTTPRMSTPSQKTTRLMSPTASLSSKIGSTSTLSLMSTSTEAPPNGLISDAKIILWDVVLSRVSEINRVHFAYLVIATMSILSTLGFSLMCCCMPCKSFRLPPENKADYRFTPRSLCTSRQNVYSIVLTIGMACLVTGIETTIYNLLTVYVIWDQHKDQARGVLLTTLYWLTVSVSRLFIAIFNRLVNYRLFLLACFGLTLLVTAILSIFSWSWTVLWLGIASLGFTVGPLFPLSYSYLDHCLGFSPWISTIWLVSAQLGRGTVPAVTAAAMEGRDSPSDLLLSVLVCSLLSCVLFIFLQRTVKAASQLMAVDAFTRQIRQANGDVAEYRRMPDDAESDLGNVEMEKLDDYLFDGDTIHFDKSAKPGLNDGIFAQYTNGHTVSKA